MTMRKLLALALAVLAALPTAALAQGCGLETVSQGSATVNYDPFGSNTTSVANGQIVLRRLNLPGGQKTEEINFFVTNLANNSLNGITLTAISAVGGQGSLGAGNGNQIFRDYPANVGNLPATIVTAPTGSLYYFKFGGNADSKDQFTFSFNMSIPPNLNIPASATLPLAIVYRCSETGNSTVTGTREGAIIVNVRVLSALQASYAGTALDFGEVGDVTTAQVLGAPATYTTPATNHVRVASSGPYSVALSSPNGYRLTFPGGSVANANQRLAYSVRFMGQTMNTASPSFATVTCARAGVPPAGSANMLPIRATLLEGGQGKQVSANYGETLVVTITPLVSTTPAGIQQNCPAL